LFVTKRRLMASATTLPALEKMRQTQQFVWAQEEVLHLAC
jgi:hypothetical protein